MALSKDKFHLRTEHSKLLGYWTVELGGLNQVTHLWEYDSYSHRAGVRAKLGGHQQWQEEYFQKILPWLQHQDNMALRSLLPPTTMADPGEAWELWQLDFSGGGNWEAKQSLSHTFLSTLPSHRDYIFFIWLTNFPQGQACAHSYKNRTLKNNFSTL